jgi:hypothetical protein
MTTLCSEEACTNGVKLKLTVTFSSYANPLKDSDADAPPLMLLVAVKSPLKGAVVGLADSVIISIPFVAVTLDMLDATLEYFVIVPIVIPPVLDTVTCIVAWCADPSLTVMVALPTPLEVITIFPPLISATATALSLEVTDVPTRPRVASLLATLLFVVSVKVIDGTYFVIVPIVIAPFAATVI